MNLEKIFTVCFSPTGTSRKAAEAVARGLADTDTERKSGTAPDATGRIQVQGGSANGQQKGNPADGVPITDIDLTHAAPGPVVIPRGAAAVIAVPVYGGKVAPIARKRLADVHGEGTPAVLVVLYGNRAFDGALEELSRIVQAQGFVPAGAAALVGEHSYSSAQHPIAAGRPGPQDIAEAEAFGRRIGQLFAAAERTKSVDSQQSESEVAQDGRYAPGNEPRTIAAVDVRKIARPANGVWPMLRFICFVLGYRRRQKRNPVVYLPATDAAVCTHCGRCIALCPAGAITKKDEEHTDSALCIRCCACVKGCPVGTRSFNTPFAAALSRNFSRPKRNVFLPR